MTAQPQLKQFQFTPTTQPTAQKAYWESVATFYHSMGLNVIPMGGYPDGAKRQKEPLNGLEWAYWQTATQTPDDVTKFDWSNPECSGLAGTSGDASGGVVYLDFDETGFDIVTEIINQMGITPADKNRWLWRGAKGWAFAVRCHGLNLDRVRVDIKSGGHIEIRHNGLYQVLPPSEHPSGIRYKTHVISPLGYVATKTPPEEISIQTLINAVGVVTGVYPVQITAKPTPIINTAPIQSTDATKDAILSALNIAHRTPNTNGFITCRCPFHDDQHPSAGLNVDNEYFLKCHTCDQTYNTRQLCEQLDIPYHAETNSKGLSINHLNTISERYSAHIARVFALLHRKYHDGAKFTAHDVLEGMANIRRDGWQRITKTDLLGIGEKIPTTGRSVQTFVLVSIDALTDLLGCTPQVFREIPDIALESDKYFSAWLVLAPIFASGEKTIAQSLLAQNSGVTDRTVRNYLHDIELQMALFGGYLEIIHNYNMVGLSLWDIEDLPLDDQHEEKSGKWIVPTENPDDCKKHGWEYPATRGGATRCWMLHGAAWLVCGKIENTYKVVAK